MRKCKTKRCTNPSAPRKGLFCHTCAGRKYKQRHAMRYCYQTLKDNAKRRGKEFTLTFFEFKKFAQKNKLLLGKGRTADSFSIDRIDNEKGYTADNIQVLTLSANSSKGVRKLEYDYLTGHATFTKPKEGITNDLQTPF